MTESDARVLQREMGCTREEFLAWLPGATRGAAIRMHGDTATVKVGRGVVEIGFREQPARTIGSVAIPVLQVSFRFVGAEHASRDAFLNYFDLHTRRGGG